MKKFIVLVLILLSANIYSETLHVTNNTGGHITLNGFDAKGQAQINIAANQSKDIPVEPITAYFNVESQYYNGMLPGWVYSDGLNWTINKPSEEIENEPFIA